MTWPTIFGNLAAGNQQLSLFDAMFNEVAQLVAIPCSASGTNAISLTGLGSSPALTSYQNFQGFRFKPAANSTGAVTIQFTGLSALPAFKKDGTTQIAANDLIAGQEYLAIFDSTRNAGNGGFFVEDAAQLPQSPALTVRGNPGAAPANAVDMTAAQTRATIYSPPFDAYAYNNLVINGGMNISQENAGNTVSLATGVPKYICDQWQASFTNGTAVVTSQQGLFTPQTAFINDLTMTATTGSGALAAGDFFRFQQSIEGFRIFKLGFGAAGAFSLTIGFWVFASISGTMTVAVRNQAANRSYVTNVVITSGGTWQYIVVTIPGDVTGTWTTDSSIGMTMTLCFGSGATFQGTNNTWNAGNFFATSATTNFFASNNNLVDIAGVFAVPGVDIPTSTQSALLFRHFNDELSTCQRYYEKSYNLNITPGTVSGQGSSIFALSPLPNAQYATNNNVQFKVPKRAVPAVTLYSTATGTSGKAADLTAVSDVNATVANIGQTQFQWQATAAAAQTAPAIAVQWSADARM